MLVRTKNSFGLDVYLLMGGVKNVPDSERLSTIMVIVDLNGRAMLLEGNFFDKQIIVIVTEELGMFKKNDNGALLS